MTHLDDISIVSSQLAWDILGLFYEDVQSAYKRGWRSSKDELKFSFVDITYSLEEQGYRSDEVAEELKTLCEWGFLVFFEDKYKISIHGYDVYRSVLRELERS